MIQEARPWLVDFYAAAALDSFLFFGVLLLGFFLVVSASRDLGFSPWVVPGVFCVFRPSSFSLDCVRCFAILMSGFGASLV